MTLSRRVAVIVSQEAAESLATFDLALRLADFLTWINQLIAQSLMVPLSVIMFQELADSRAKRRLAEEDKPRKGFVLEASHEPFQVWIQIR
jgi:hypothetical protein